MPSPSLTGCAATGCTLASTAMAAAAAQPAQWVSRRVLVAFIAILSLLIIRKASIVCESAFNMLPRLPG